jgi:aminoglycoside phosphotransferase (APT) family kinase protein
MVMPDGELLLIDMGDASMGDPRIDLAGTYHVVRVAGSRPGGAMRFCGMPQDMLERLWDVFARAYFDVTDDVQLEEIERKLAFFALPRTMGSTARSKLLTEEVRRRQARELEQAFLAGVDSLS